MGNLQQQDKREQQLNNTTTSENFNVKPYQVHFSRPTIGKNRKPLSDYLNKIINEHGKDCPNGVGKNLPVKTIQQRKTQLRSLCKEDSIWRGVYAYLKNKQILTLDRQDNEELVELDNFPFERLFFLYDESNNTLIWQYDQTVGTMPRAANYLQEFLQNGEKIKFQYIPDAKEVEKLLSTDIFELDLHIAMNAYTYANETNWGNGYKDAIEAFRNDGTSDLKLTLKADRGSILGKPINDWAKELYRKFFPKKMNIRNSASDKETKLVNVHIRSEIEVLISDSKVISPDEIYKKLFESYNEVKDQINNYYQNS